MNTTGGWKCQMLLFCFLPWYSIAVLQHHFSLPLLCLSSLPFSGDGESKGVVPAMSRLEKAYPG